jgi:hypothetical protein
MALECPHALILDDGELDDVRLMLLELGVPYADDPHAGGKPERAIPLIISTPARARAHVAWKNGCRIPPHYLHIVIWVGDASGTGEVLDDIPCDFVVQRPIEPAVLRLLTQRAGYGGPERRRMLRVAIGAPIGLWVGEQRSNALLTQLSVGGCGLVSDEPREEGSSIAIEFPRDLTAPRELHLCGRVLSARPVIQEEKTRYEVSVAFEAVELGDRVTLRAVMAGQPIGFRPKVWPMATPGLPATAPAARAPRRRRSVIPASSDRRAQTRRLFNRRVLGGDEGIARILIGRDLSKQGLRVEREARFALGDALKLALYGGVGSSPVMLKAVVERDDGELGWYLRFEALTPAVARDIEKLLDSLVPVDLPDGAGRVLTEVLESA